MNNTALVRRFAWVGLAALLAASSVTALRTGLLPRWLAWSGFVAKRVKL